MITLKEVVKQEFRVRENRNNGKWQLLLITLYSDNSVSRNVIKEYYSYEEAMKKLCKINYEIKELKVYEGR